MLACCCCHAYQKLVIYSGGTCTVADLALYAAQFCSWGLINHRSIGEHVHFLFFFIKRNGIIGEKKFMCFISTGGKKDMFKF
jgi:hypothetical protein